MTKRYFITSLIAFLWFTPLSHAEDCLASTNRPNIVGNHPGILNEKLDPDRGFYVASLENGDQLLIHWGHCELALRGHYLFREEQSRQSRNATIELFLSGLLTSQKALQKVAQQLKSLEDSDFTESVILQGINDEHKLTITSSKSPLFAKEIHYEWLPPQH